MMHYTIGIDLGGTKFRVGIVDNNFNLFGKTFRYDSYDCSDAKTLLLRMVEGINKTIRENGLNISDISSIGIGSPGPLDPYKGIILETLNLTIFQNFPLKSEMEKHFDISVFVDNDANCFGLGEQKGGKARGLKHLIAITLGTGYGFSYILNGQVLHGATGTATEIANTPYLDGGYEDYISGRGLQIIHQQLHNENISPVDISKRAFDGDKKCLNTFDQFGRHLANTLLPYVTALDPDMIVVGGSIAANWDFFKESLDRTIRSKMFEKPKQHLRIEKSELGELATIIGAAGLSNINYEI